MSNNNSIWFLVDKDGIEWWHDANNDANGGVLFHGAIKAITGKTLTWQDEPIEWKPGERHSNCPHCGSNRIEQSQTVICEWCGCTSEI